MRLRALYRAALLPIVTGIAAGCGSDGGEIKRPLNVLNAEDAPLPTSFGSTPNPTPKGWTGTGVDLLVADAWAACAYETPVGGTPTPMPSLAEMDATDTYLTSVSDNMAKACPASTAAKSANGPFAAWSALRNDATCYDPGTAPVALEQTAMPTYLSGNPGVALRTASVNYCIAQRLRGASPGASALQALSMTASDQRQLLQIIHERAQVAMLQYSLLGMAFTTPKATGNVARYGIQTEAGQLRAWADAPANAPYVTATGKDFAGVIELDLGVTQELADLFSHLAAADESRAGTTLSVSDAVWGKASWRQRLMGLLYGGDPLVNGAANGTIGADPTPGIGLPAAFVAPTVARLISLDNPTQIDWPSKVEMPYASVSVSDAHVTILRALAQQIDNNLLGSNGPSATTPGILNLKVATGTSACLGTDIATSASQLYRNLEAILQWKYCVAGDGTNGTSVSCPAAPDPASLPDEKTNFKSFMLWTKHQLTPSHATTLVSQLDDLVGDYCSGTWVDGARPGGLDVGGTITPVTINGQTWRHVSGIAGSGANAVQFAPRLLEEMAPLFARQGRFRMPKGIDYAVPLEQQGLVSSKYNNNAERKRALGTIPAFAATREALETIALQTTNGSAAFLRFHDEIAGALAAAIGQSTVGVSAHAVVQALGKPAGYFGPDVSPRQPAIFAQTVKGGVVSSAGPDDLYDWDVDISMPISDAFWDSSQLSLYSLIAIPNDPHAATFARFPSSSRDNKSLSTLMPSAYGSTTSPTADPSGSGLSDGLARFHFTIALPRKSRWTILVQRKDTKQTQLVASNVTLSSFTESCDGTSATDDKKHSYLTATVPSSARPYEGQYYAFGGQLGMTALRTLAPDTTDPTLPAFDGFGLPRHFVPPPDPNGLESGTSGTSLADYHVGQATKMAADAQMAVQKVLDNLLKVATDSVSETTAANASAGAINDAQTNMCGTDLSGQSNGQNPCDTKLTAVSIDFSGDFLDAARKPDGSPVTAADFATCTLPDLSVKSIQSDDTWKKYVPDPQSVLPVGNDPPDMDADLKKVSDGVSTYLDCQTYNLLKSIKIDAQISEPVVAVAFDPKTKRLRASQEAPSFLEINGGELQTKFVAEWAALVQAQNAAQQVALANSDSKAHITQFVAAFQGVNDKAQDNCSPAAMLEAVFAGLSVGVSVGFTPSVSVSMSAGPEIAQQQKCKDLKADIDGAAQQAIAGMWDAMLNTVTQATKLTDAGAAVQAAAASAAQTVNQANIATNKAKLDAQLTKDALQTSFGLWRQLANADVIQAQNKLMNARRQALLARRAIEATYVVDLSTLYGSEFLVSQPFKWANDIYTMDLDIAAAVGLSVGTTNPTSIYPYDISQYVDNLVDFRAGFGDTRNLLQAGDELSTVVELGSPTTIEPTGSVSWLFFCPRDASIDVTGQNGTWIQVPPAADQDTWKQRLTNSCDQQILRAKVSFSLDPWGQLGFAAPNADYKTQFNARWDRVFINLRGTSVCDPTIANGTTDACIKNQYLGGTLTQLAPTWTTDYNDVWTPLGFETATLEGVNALEVGNTFGGNAWNDPALISWIPTAARHGFDQRPLGGFYELQLNRPVKDGSSDPRGPDPAFNMAHLEGVQLIIQAKYWQRN